MSRNTIKLNSYIILDINKKSLNTFTSFRQKSDTAMHKKWLKCTPEFAEDVNPVALHDRKRLKNGGCLSRTLQDKGIH